jgi:hypothetical protein
MATIDKTKASANRGPRAPNLTLKDLHHQFWADIYGKEVQDATTYSYVWMADQMGHACLGIIINFALTLAARHVLPWLGYSASYDEITGLVVGSIAVSVWEFSAFRNAVRGATGLFPLDRKLLRENAITAAAYMVLGVVVGYVFHKSETTGIVGFILAVVVGILGAPPWLRQKITWQKAALPYLFRLADAQRTVGVEVAQNLQALIDVGNAPPDRPARQIVIGGPIGSGRTNIAAGIGTEFAFKRAMVRYVSFASLLEFAAQPSRFAQPPELDFADDRGPKNVHYWPWSQAQVLIIDDIGPVIAAITQGGRPDRQQFQEMLANGLGAVAPVLAACHTVWVMGDLRGGGQTAMKGDTLDDFARDIARFCQTQQPALVVELSDGAAPPREAAPATIVVQQPAEIRQVAPRAPVD